MMKPKEEQLEIFTPDLSTKTEVPLVAGTVPAGFPSPAENFLDRPLDLNEWMIRNPASTFIMRVRGDSMIGDGILPGDFLVVDKAAEVRSGCLAVCVLEGEFTLKRLELHEDYGYLVPSNTRYEPIYVDGDMQFSVWGVVRGVIRRM